MSCAVEPDAAGGRLDQPQDTRAPPSTCRSRTSPTSPRVSPAPMEKLTPSTASTCADGAAQQAVLDRDSACSRPSTSSTADAAASVMAAVAPSECQQAAQCARPLLLERRIFRAAARIAKRAARREGAARRQVWSVTAPCRGSPRAAPARPRRRPMTVSRGIEPSRPGYRDGAAGRTAPRRRPPRLSGRHT